MTGRARSYMASPVVTVTTDTPLALADELLSEGAISAVAVTDVQGSPVGVLSLTDLFSRATKATPSGALVVPDLPVSAAMTEGIVSVGPDAPLRQVCTLMLDEGVHRVFVREGDALLGVLSTQDVMEAVASLRIAIPIESLMTKDVLTVQVHDNLALAASRLRAVGKHALVVLDGEWPVGTISQDEILLARDWPDDTAVESWMNLRMLTLPKAMPAFRAAAHALAMGARHVLAMSDMRLEGIVSALDFNRAVLQLKD